MLLPTFHSHTNASESLVILSWNVQNYTLADRYQYDRYQREYPKPEVEKSALRAVVAELAPDVLLLQEIGGEEFLRELVIDLRKQQSLDYPYFACVDAQDKERKLGLISKIPFEWIDHELNAGKTFQYLGKDESLKRGLLEVRVRIGDRELTLMEMHLKSRITSDEADPNADTLREKEARLIRDYIRGQLAGEPDRAVLLFGDLNDYPDSAPYRRLTEVSGQRLLTELEVQDSRGEVWTYYYRKQRRYEQIDYVFLSPSLGDQNLWQLEATIMGGQSVTTASDHRPILLNVKTLP